MRNYMDCECETCNQLHRSIHHNGKRCVVIRVIGSWTHGTPRNGTTVYRQHPIVNLHDGKEVIRHVRVLAAAEAKGVAA